MVKTFLLILLFLFVVCGICDFIYFLRIMFFYPKIRVKNYSFVILDKRFAVSQINFLWQKIKWHGDGFAVGVIALTDFIDKNELSLCKEFAKNKNIILCDSDTVLDILNDKKR